MRLLLACCALMVTATAALASERQDPKVVAVRMITLAEIASEYCPQLSVKASALEHFLLRAKVKQSDVLARYADVVSSVARTFATLASNDQDAACSQIWNILGDHGLGLVARQSRMQ